MEEKPLETSEKKSFGSFLVGLYFWCAPMVVTTVTVKRKLWPKLQLDLWRQIDR